MHQIPYNGYGAPGQMTTVRQASGVSRPAAMGIQKTLVRVGEQALYSTHAFEADGTTRWQGQYDVFASPVNSTGQGFTGRNLTLSETNLLEAGRIPTGLSFKVYGVGCHPYGLLKNDATRAAGAGTKAYALSLADYNAIQAYGILEWIFLNTNIQIAPIQAVGAAGGTFAGTADTGAAYGGANTTGMGSMFAANHGGGAYWTYNAWPVELGSDITLRVRINFAAPTGPIIDGGPVLEGTSAPAYDPAIKVMLFGVYEQAIPT